MEIGTDVEGRGDWGECAVAISIAVPGAGVAVIFWGWDGCSFIDGDED